MREVNGEFSFIETPLEFFGHGKDEIYFGYPAAYHQQIANTKVQSEEIVAALAAKRQELMASGNTQDRDYTYLVPDEQFALEVERARNQGISSVKHEWYERRFRGRYASQVEEQHPEAVKFFNWFYYDEIGPPPPAPETNVMAAYFNDRIAHNEWYGSQAYARTWYKHLPEEHPDRGIAAAYAGFAGNIVLHEYCRIAEALATDQLADDDFVSFKHLFTVCLPLAYELEEYIPDEVAHVKQFLREVFMQYALRGGESARNYADRFGYLLLDEPSPQSFAERSEQEQRALALFMRYTNADTLAPAEMFTKLFALADRLEIEHKWYQAIDVLDLAKIAFGLDPTEIQSRIDQLAANAVQFYTADMSKYEDPWLYQRGKRSFWTNNAQEARMIGISYGISDEARTRLEQMVQSRSIEYTFQQLEDHPKPAEIDAFFDLLERADKSVCRQFADSDIINQYVDQNKRTAIIDKLPSDIDGLVQQFITLSNRGVLSIEHRDDLLMTIADRLCERVRFDPEFHEAFERFVGFISPIMRATTATENPQDELIWKYITPAQFEMVMDYTIARNETANRHEDVAWYRKHKRAFLENVRAAYNAYWDEVETYD